MTNATLTASRDHHCHAHDAHLSFTEWAITGISRWIGKCRQCKRAVRVEVQQATMLTWQYSHPDKMAFSKRMYQYTALTAGATHHMSRQGNYVTVACPTGCTVTYGIKKDYTEPARITCKRIEGVYSDSVKCNAKCMNATGPNCECQCAGENHGAGHAL